MLSGLANVDWNIVAAGAATFIVTAFATARGFLKGKKKVAEKGKAEVTIAGASLMDNMTMLQLSQDIRQLDHTITRLCDLILMGAKFPNKDS